MLFTEPVFLFYFLPAALILHTLTLSVGGRGEYHALSRVTLFVLTLVFYGYREPWWLLPFFICIGFDFLWGTLLAREERPRARKLLVTASIVQNITLLAVFKYWGFVLETAASVSPSFASHLPRFLGNGQPLSLPPGISFYTFESLSFVIDVYRREVEPPRGVSEFLAFIGMFPRFIAGPIVRYRVMVPQLRKYAGPRIESGLTLFAVGLFLKLCFADQFARFLPYAFERSTDIGFLAAWTGAIAYAMQVYFDLLGYSFMAIGLGRCLGFEFPKNFDKPYLSDSVQSFWNRWHITLGHWLRVYVFLPLALKVRKTRFGVAGAMLLTMFIIGVWHGAGWPNVLMGLWFGLVAGAEVLFNLPERLTRWQGRLVTFFAVMVGWVLGASKTVPQAFRILGAMFNPLSAGGSFNPEGLLSDPIALGLCGLGFVYCFVVEPRVEMLEWVDTRSPVRAPVAFAMFVSAVFIGLSTKMVPFLYFQF